ncbi:hypothetical protein ACMU_06325 [Actibacterium mucosum KCTC 23349]|uniref:Uncharacterized protein n=1 Tax=Actibacterium mucosum KCTC 23349 TaxID=1454373 RepID=A0A037ZLN1_9RHOB|nr:hypothetical protein ACMU_06325 [Actibacterium mucosum KCTC 23349]
MLALLTAALAHPALAACPAETPEDPRRAVLMDQVRVAQSNDEARLLTNQLWEIWANAPDDHAQDILDEGLQRRSYGDLAGARVAFDALIDYCPNYAEGYNQRAFLAFMQGQHSSAIPDLERAVELAPDHFAALTGLALAQLGEGAVELGQDTLRRALEMNPWLPERRFLDAQVEQGTDL